MSGAIINKLELDVMQANEILDAADLTSKYGLPAMVVHPTLTPDAFIAKARRQGLYKIITPVDWPKGEARGFAKLRGLTVEALGTDGFEIIISNRNMEEINEEARAIAEFIRKQILFTAEVRFVVPVQLCTEDDVVKMARGLIGVPTPDLIRLDTHLKLQTGKANPDTHNHLMNRIKEVISLPLKLSGNINNVRAAMLCNTASRFAVNILQAKTIIKEVSKQPDELKSLLSEPEEQHEVEKSDSLS